tara:strand:- start:866 stop:1216 length:351 start_codon:yes stop_codon:yes gene_type:complete
MAEVTNRTLRLSAPELKEMTDWPDPMIEEFLSLLDSLNNLVISNNAINTVVIEGEGLDSETQGQIGWIISRMRRISKNVAAVEELVAQANAMVMQAFKKSAGVNMAQVAARINAGQ